MEMVKELEKNSEEAYRNWVKESRDYIRDRFLGEFDDEDELYLSLKNFISEHCAELYHQYNDFMNLDIENKNYFSVRPEDIFG